MKTDFEVSLKIHSTSLLLFMKLFHSRLFYIQSLINWWQNLSSPILPAIKLKINIVLCCFAVVPQKFLDTRRSDLIIHLSESNQSANSFSCLSETREKAKKLCSNQFTSSSLR